MDYQEKSNLKIGVSGAGKKYLKMPWSIEDTIKNLEGLKEIMQRKLIMTNYHGRGEKDSEEIAFDFDRAIQALKENQEYKKLGTLEEVRETVERQRAKKPKTKILCGDIEWWCPNCGESHIMMDSKKGFDFCHHCGQKLDWGE